MVELLCYLGCVLGSVIVAYGVERAFRPISRVRVVPTPEVAPPRPTAPPEPPPYWWRHDSAPRVMVFINDADKPTARPKSGPNGDCE